MKYKRMAFNAELQEENTKLRAKLAELEAQKGCGNCFPQDCEYPKCLQKNN